MDVFGNHTGIVSGSQSFTYARFGERCQRLAAALAALGIQAGDRVAYISFNNHQLMEGYYGVVQARALVGVEVVRQGNDPAILIVNPGSYFIDFTVIDDIDSAEAGACQSNSPPQLVAISTTSAASDPVIYLSQDGPADYRIFVHSKSFSARDAAALIVGARGGHHRLAAASL
jgi:acyl-CoA synthetase (AMP-forming)/AMP-acid ligase II